MHEASFLRTEGNERRQYLKIFVLGECIAAALVNTVGHSVTGDYDNELPKMQYMIDSDFIKEPRHNVFWHELLRNQLYYTSKRNPLPILHKWGKKGHPFLEKHTENGQLNFNELFSRRLNFVPSHEHYEIRIADAVNTIVSRYLNKRQCIKAYKMVKQCFCKDKRVCQFVLSDFDLQSYHYDPNENPWRKLSEELNSHNI